MIQYKLGNILTETTEAIVNTVNCVGVMGRGIALQFKKIFPDNYIAYAKACKDNEVCIGKMFIYENKEKDVPKYIINFPTKRHWKTKSQMQDIESGLVALKNEIKTRQIKSIAIPPLGCGLGGLRWLDVRKKIEDTFIDMQDIEVIIYEPQEKHHTTILKSASTPRMTAGRASLVWLMDCYLQGLLDPFISLLEVHKLMYFMQEAGEPLQLKFKKALYGPYAENLRHVLNAIEGHYISGYADGGDKPNKPLQLLPNVLQQAENYLKEQDKLQTHQHVERVRELVDGFESGFGLELLATVHWVVTKEQASSAQEAIQKVHAWNARKKQFTERQILIAYERLEQMCWF